MHLWQVARGDYGWLTPDLAIYRDYDLGDAREVATGIDGVVLVQAAPTEAETDFLLDIARHSDGFVRGMVGWTDLAAADAPERIAALSRDKLLKGLRPMLQDIADPDWVLRDDVARGLDAMTKAGLALDLLIRPVHLPRCIRLAERHPGLAMVIDHCAKPNIAGGAFAPWADAIGAVAGQTAMRCKLSGLVTEAEGDAGLDDIAPYVRHAIRAFGPDRLIWGSDWPVLTLASGYETWRAAAEALVRQELPLAEASVFGGNAARFYRLGGLETDLPSK